MNGKQRLESAGTRHGSCPATGPGGSDATGRGSWPGTGRRPVGLRIVSCGAALSWLVLLLVSSCDSAPPGGSPDADAVSSDADAEGGADADADADADAESDSPSEDGAADLPPDDADASDGADTACTPNTNECGPDGCGDWHADCAPGETCADGSCVELAAAFLATFEGGTTTADRGRELIDNRNGGSMAVVANPFPSESNGSDYVLRVEVPAGTSVRAEYHSQRLETDEKTYIYVWRQHYERDFLVGADVSWLVFAQWKTWPCGEYDGGYGDVICAGGGIFNDIELTEGSLYEIRFRADPDCNFVTTSIWTEEVWDTYVLEIYWTNTSDGYYRLFRNDGLLVEQTGVKTLFDRFPADTGECNMYWGLGLYASWADEGSSALVRHVDDLAIYDRDAGVELPMVCPRCGS
ncbi:MAG: heparin lyase I family protein [Deltaproteobacteria bacterium]|nr:heparin lyase I family protein [Deltaproteobacteria bacterium]